ncbi:MAG: SWIM zinc finger family protein [Anaerolineae bacterium]|nr:SWIM zinc finger family protein [Anaerolineae bacterium]
MSVHWTPEQVTALAPDSSSLKTAEKLAAASKWVTSGCDDQALWGECKGSSARPYQTVIDLSEPAFHCSCPSRKFPCKHGLGLFLLFTRDPGSIKTASQPGWVSDWLAKRAARAAKAEARATEKPSDPAAQARRIDQRHNKVLSGLTELDLWLTDLMRRGLADARSQPYHYWEGVASRMVDSQAPGLARHLREMGSIAASSANWQDRLLRKVSLVYLLSQGYQRLDTLSPETQADVRTAVGWTIREEEITAQPGLQDRWIVLGRRVEEQDDIRTQRTWLWGIDNAQIALILDFAYRNQPLDTSLLPGTWFDADVAFYPGAVSLRAAMRKRLSDTVPIDDLPGYSAFDAVIASYTAMLTRNPWIEEVAFTVCNVIPIADSLGWGIRDQNGTRLPIAPAFAKNWELMAMSGGHAVTLITEWDGMYLVPLSVWADGRLVMV